MPQPWTSSLGNEAVAQLVGSEAFARGMAYAQGGHVHDVAVDETAMSVSGRVKGTYRDDYAVTVSLVPTKSGAPAYRGRCTCPVAQNCKHVAAVLIVARYQADLAPVVHRPEWERAVGKLLAGPVPDPPRAEVAPLALEFGVERIPAYRGYVGRQDLRIRPARRAPSGAWVRSGISWEDLDFVARSYCLEHRELLLQFRAAAGAGARYALPRTPWLSLGTVSSALWGLLDQAAAVGLALLAAKPLLGPLRASTTASVTLDAQRAGAAGLRLTPRVLLEDQPLPLARVGVLGDPAHGVCYTREATGDPGAEPVEELVVARLDGLLSRELRQLVIDAQSLVVPVGDEPRFLTEFVPQLRARVPITSSDHSVALPERPAPRLALTVQFRPEHRVRMDWAVEYVVAGQPHTFPLDEPAEDRTVRDLDAERRLLAALPLPDDTLRQLSGSPAGRRIPDRPAAHALLEGRAAFTFVEHVLPLLEKEGVQVTLAGEVVDYREASSEPSVEVATADLPDSSDWFDLHVEVSVEGERVPFDEVFVALTRGEEFLVLDTGVYCALDRPEFAALAHLIEESKALQDSPRSELRISRYQTSLWEDLVNLGVVVEQSARWARTVRELAGGASEQPAAVPPTLQADLRPYQVEGYRWLHLLWASRLGGILADDMGLGKTVQALAMICQARLTEPERPPFLVVAPTSVVSNWAAETARFAPGLRVVVVTGSQARRRTPLGEVVAGADLVVTSYALLRIDAERYAALPWSGLILDEAQFVKNHRARTYQAARRVDAPFKLAITGTPLENSLMDLWSLLSITAPGLFPHPERFSEYYRRPIERHHDPALLAQLRRRVQPLMLRRTKERVAAELPAKQEQVVEVELAPRHMRIYQTHLQRERRRVLGLIEDLDQNRFTILRSLTLLRRLSLDAALVDTAHAGVPAAKVEVLLRDLSELVAEGHQALVFSQFTSFLGSVRARLVDAGISHAYLDGSTTQRERVVEGFRSGAAAVFLISLKAGGFGLNLPEAGYCFLLDPWWNPATETQAIDRTHRIGQTKTVMVYRLVAKGTIEEKVMALKARKRELFDAVLGEESLAAAALTAEEIRTLVAP